MPGTLLETVAGRRVMGIQREEYLLCASRSWESAWKPSKPPMMKRPSILYCLNRVAMSSIPDSEGSSRLVPISEPPFEAQLSTSSQSNSRTEPKGLSEWWRAKPAKPLWMARGV